MNGHAQISLKLADSARLPFIASLYAADKMSMLPLSPFFVELGKIKSSSDFYKTNAKTYNHSIFYYIDEFFYFSPDDGSALSHFDATGNATDFQQIIDRIGNAEVVFLGENHDDATAHALQSEFLKKTKNSLVIHLNGAFHTENRLGTVEHLLKYSPKTRILVVTMRYEDDFTKFDKAKHTGLGDFVILTDAKVPRTFR